MAGSASAEEAAQWPALCRHALLSHHARQLIRRQDEMRCECMP